MAEENQPSENTENTDKKETQRKRPGKKPLIILGIVVIVMVIVALVWWFMTRNQETTDDAFTEGDAVTIAPKTAGYVTELRVRDNQRVTRQKPSLAWPKRSFIRPRRSWRSRRCNILPSGMKPTPR